MMCLSIAQLYISPYLIIKRSAMADGQYVLNNIVVYEINCTGLGLTVLNSEKANTSKKYLKISRTKLL